MINEYRIQIQQNHIQQNVYYSAMYTNLSIPGGPKRTEQSVF